MFDKKIEPNCGKEEFLKTFKNFYKHFMMWQNMNSKKWNYIHPGTPNYRYMDSIKNMLNKTVNFQNHAHQG